ncbi:uncharacterized transmembrane protein DDB_G0289901 [Drosophila eugracilis]|uniref:uncharacterized transmembrane protein DDB_G0289901 n=1 Tax=Drosophila eugracilis TaxID=29029 RepID=UPI001BD91B16|nr:uncharacterized transmembrane protein DDB_G0289901 [Drosophila eugracilis]
MDYRQLKNDAYGIGQRRGMGSSVGGGGVGGGGGMYSSNFGGGGNYGGGGNSVGGGGYGGNRNQNIDGGNFNRGGYNNNSGGNNNNFPRSGDDRSSFNQNNQRFAGNSGDNYQDNFRGGGDQSSNFVQSNRGPSSFGNLTRQLDLEASQNRNPGNSGNFSSDRQPDNFRGHQSQGYGDRFQNDDPRNQGSFGNFGPNNGPSFVGNNGGNNGPSFGGNNGPSYGGNNDPSYGGNNDPSYGGINGSSYGGNSGPSYGGNSSNFNNDNFSGRGSNFNNQQTGFNDSYGRGGNQGNFDQNSGNFGGNNQTGNFNDRGPGGGGSGGPGFNPNSGGNFSDNNSGGGFSNNISRSFNDSRNKWNNSQSQTSSFQAPGYQSNSGGRGGGGGGAPSNSGWEASQRAFNSKRNQLQKMNLNNGGSVRKPGPQPTAKAVQNLRNNPRAAAAVVKSVDRSNGANNRNIQPSKPGNIRSGNAAGVQKNVTNAVANQTTVNYLAPKPSTVTNKKPSVAGHAVRRGPGVVRSGHGAVVSGPGAVRSGPQGVKPGPQAQKPGAPAVRAGQPTVKSGPQAAKPAVANRPPKAPGLTVQVGQKRVAPPPPLDTVAAPKSVKKWRRVARKRGFLIGGYKIPYMNDQPKKLPQPEADSYALTFFEQNFNYSTNQDATEEDFLDAAVVLNEDSEDESVADDDKSARKIAKRNRKRLRSEWAPLYESKKYNVWANWWKDYKKVGEEIDKQLLESGNLNLEHCFLPNLPKLSTEQVVYAIIKSAHFGLEKNADVPYDTLKTIFTLMNRTFLENITELNMVEIQDIIRGIPNDLWVYKMRSMVYLWEKYKTVINSKSTAEEDINDQKAIAREWKSPCFHWCAKQAFDELVAISATEWKDHESTFPTKE